MDMAMAELQKEIDEVQKKTDEVENDIDAVQREMQWCSSSRIPVSGLPDM